MARIDKIAFSFRGLAGQALTGLTPVKISTTGGSVVKAGSAEAVGVVCVPGTIAAGRPVSVLVNAEVVEFTGVGPGTAAYAMGTAGAGSVGPTTGGTSVGFVVESGRLVINM